MHLWHRHHQSDNKRVRRLVGNNMVLVLVTVVLPYSGTSSSSASFVELSSLVVLIGGSAEDMDDVVGGVVCGIACGARFSLPSEDARGLMVPRGSVA
jgi:hypothetical protein